MVRENSYQLFRIKLRWVALCFFWHQVILVLTNTGWSELNGYLENRGKDHLNLRASFSQPMETDALEDQDLYWFISFMHVFCFPFPIR